MEIAQVRTQAPTAQAAVGTAQNGAPQAAGDFLALIAQLLSGGEGENQEDLMAMLSASQDEGNAKQEQDALQNAMQMLSGLFLPQFAMQAPTESSDQAVEGMPQTGAELRGLWQNAPVTASDPTQANDNLFEVVAHTTAQSGGTQADSQANDFSSLFKQAAKMPSTSSAKEKPLDIDALQTAVDQMKFLDNTAFASRLSTASVSQPNEAEALDILSQVKTGILSQLGDKKSELIIKLEPEGLGKVTVRMIETAGRVSLSIIASTKQAEAALSNHIGDLQQALKPHNAEVTQVVATEQQGQTFMNSHGFGGSQQQQNSFGRQPEFHHGQAQAEDEAIAFSQQVEVDSALDSYV